MTDIRRNDFLAVISAGLFHYRHYVHYLSQNGVLDKFYYSHKISAMKQLPALKRSNLFLKEYLMYAHIRIAGTESAFRMMYLYNAIWEACCFLLFKPAPINLFLMQGNCLTAMRRARSAGRVVIGEAVNIHPRRMKVLMDQDAAVHGVPFFWSASVFDKKVQEIEELDFLLTPSTTVAQSYIDEGFDPSKIAVLPYGAASLGFGGEVEVKNVKQLSSGSIKVLCVAQIFPRKGQFHLLKALHQYKGKLKFDITFVGIANQRYLDSMRGIGISFNHIGSLSHDGVLAKMRDCDVVVLNSLEDGFGMVVTEAMSVGTPVAVSKFAGASELVSRLGGGIVYDPNDYDAAVDAFIRCSTGDYRPLSGVLDTWSEYASQLELTIQKLTR